MEALPPLHPKTRQSLEELDAETEAGLKDALRRAKVESRLALGGARKLAPEAIEKQVERFLVMGAESDSGLYRRYGVDLVNRLTDEYAQVYFDLIPGECPNHS